MKTILSIAGTVLGILGGSVCVAAGVYLLSFKSGAAVEAGSFDASALDVIEHGVGIYAIGKGLAVWAITAFSAR